MFKLGSQVGLKPQEVLDCSLDMFNAVVEGYKDRLLDQEILSIQGGFFAGYYNRAKKPKSLKSIITALIRKSKIQSSNGGLKPPAPDIEKFQELEQRFFERRGELKRG